MAVPVNAKERCDRFLRLPGSPQLTARLPGIGSGDGNPSRIALYPVYFEATQRIGQANGLLGLKENFDFTSRHHLQDGLI